MGEQIEGSRNVEKDQDLRELADHKRQMPSRLSKQLGPPMTLMRARENRVPQTPAWRDYGRCNSE